MSVFNISIYSHCKIKFVRIPKMQIDYIGKGNKMACIL